MYAQLLIVGNALIESHGGALAKGQVRVGRRSGAAEQAVAAFRRGSRASSCTLQTKPTSALGAPTTRANFYGRSLTNRTAAHGESVPATGTPRLSLQAEASPL